MHAAVVTASTLIRSERFKNAVQNAKLIISEKFMACFFYNLVFIQLLSNQHTFLYVIALGSCGDETTGTGKKSLISTCPNILFLPISYRTAVELRPPLYAPPPFRPPPGTARWGRGWCITCRRTSAGRSTCRRSSAPRPSTSSERPSSIMSSAASPASPPSSRSVPNCVDCSSSSPLPIPTG